MTQSTYAYGATANISGPAFRADHNAMATAIASQNEGTTAPSPTYAGMWWRDTGNTLLKQRNSANSAWVTIGTLDSANLGLALNSALTSHTGGASGVHGVTGNVVGTSDTQTLTNKTFTAAVLGGITDLSGGQIKFPAAQSASADANTLDDYEEGSWTPTDGSGAGLSFSVATGNYIKIGKMVFCRYRVTYPTTADASAARISGLPFTTSSGIPGAAPVGYSNYGASMGSLLGASGTAWNWVDMFGSNIANSALSGKDIRGTVTYEASA